MGKKEILVNEEVQLVVTFTQAKTVDDPETPERTRQGYLGFGIQAIKWVTRNTMMKETDEHSVDLMLEEHFWLTLLEKAGVKTVPSHWTIKLETVEPTIGSVRVVLESREFKD